MEFAILGTCVVYGCDNIIILLLRVGARGCTEVLTSAEESYLLLIIANSF